jgi:type I restriction enzyme S subunit
MGSFVLKTLEEVGTFYNGVTGKSKEDFVDGNAKFITYMNIFKNPSLRTDVEDTIRITEGECQNTVQYGDILFTTSSETPDECGMSSVLEIQTNEPLYLNSFCFGFRFNDLSNIIPGFYKHLFRSSRIRAQIAKTANGVTRFNVSKKLFAKIQIPLPPLPIQQRIVEILDKFTSLVSSLDSEIALRQKQYEFAGERIFCSIDQQYQWIPLGDVCEVFDGVHQTPEYVEKGIRFVSVENIDDIYGSNKYITEDAYNKYKNKPKVGDIFMTRITAGVIGQCAIVDKDEPLAYYVSLALLRPKKGISSRYLRAYLHSSTGKKELRKWIKVDATPTKINKGDINKVLILVPSFNRQLSIVRTLDTFESLLTNLKKERELRQKQYEYYREKLLTFA